MVSLAVVVGAVLAVLLLAFSGPDKPATTRRLRRRARRTAARPRPHALSGSASSPARVFQEELALPAGAGGVRRGRSRPAQSPAASFQPTARRVPAVGEFERQDRWARLRSSLALLFLLTVVGTMLAGAIGTALFLAGLALRDAVR